MHHTALRSTLASLVVLAGTTSADLAAQGSYVDLGRGTAYSVSHDGRVVAGSDFSGAYRWTQAGGFQQLGLVRGIYDLSADGSVMTGDLDPGLTTSGSEEGAFWTQATGWQSVGFLPNANPGGCPSLSNAYACNADGSVVVGLSWNGCTGRAFRWSAATGIADLGLLGRNARANCVSGDGMIVGGWDGSATTGARRAAVWFPGGLEVLLIPPSPQNTEGRGEVWDLNSDGSVIVGEESNAQAFRWTQNGGFESLGAFPGSVGGDTGAAYATSEDGSVIVGSSGAVIPNVGPKFEAFVWTEEDGMLPMSHFLENQQLAWPAGPAFSAGFDVTPDGTTIVGRRGSPVIPPDFDRGFVIHLPPGIRYGIGASPANTLSLVGSGSNSLGGRLTVTTRKAAGPETFTLVSAKSAEVPLLGGTVLVDLSRTPVVLRAPTTGGVSTINIDIPNSPAYLGGVIYLQSLTLDSAKPAGVAMSNGIKVVIKK